MDEKEEAGLSFKIVQTIEKGELKITAVPSIWEKDGLLFWPPKSAKISTFKKPGNPGDDWTKFPCVVKRTNIQSYREAAYELKQMEERSDTSSSEQTKMTTNCSIIRRPKRKRSLLTRNSTRNDFNELLATPLSEDETTQVNVKKHSDQVSVIEPSTVKECNDFQLHATPSSTREADDYVHLILNPREIENAEVIIDQEENIDPVNADGDVEPPSITALLLTIMENQTRMDAKVEQVLKNMEKLQKIVLGANRGGAVQPLDFDTIDDIEKLKNFEEKLKENEFFQTMVGKCQMLCGRNLKGDDVSFSIVDHLFTRRFFTKVTMTGTSRTGYDKECFQKYDRTINLFFHVVHSVDSNYSLKDTKDFFQKIISNSKRRSESFGTRNSRVKILTFSSENRNSLKGSHEEGSKTSTTVGSLDKNNNDFNL